MLGEARLENIDPPQRPLGRHSAAVFGQPDQRASDQAPATRGFSSITSAVSSLLHRNRIAVPGANRTLAFHLYSRSARRATFGHERRLPRADCVPRLPPRVARGLLPHNVTVL